MYASGSGCRLTLLCGPHPPSSLQAVQPQMGTFWADHAVAGGGNEHGVTAEHPQEDLLTASHSEFCQQHGMRQMVGGAVEHSVALLVVKQGRSDLSWGADFIITGGPQVPPGHCPVTPEFWEPDDPVRVYLQEGVLNLGFSHVPPLPCGSLLPCSFFSLVPS